MEQIIKRITYSGIALSVIGLIIGLILVIRPGTSLVTVGVIVGVYLLAHGLDLMIVAIGNRGYYVPYNAAVQGAISFILGLLLLKNPVSLMTLLSIVIGVWVVITGVDHAKIALSMKKVEGTPWLIMLVFGGIDIIIGFYITMVPEIASLSIIVCVGLVMIIHSIINISNMILIKKNCKEMEELIKEL
ncbi:MAG: DUF308 domain-containing protein [Eubacterium sp.]|nr:DUF308 domain-containing protein [Eubacterium sp.]